MKFLNRSEELAKLGNVWRGVNGHPAFITLYGRRRCGKSTLLRQMLRREDIYFMAIQGEAGLQRRLLARELGKKFPAFDAVQYADYDQLFTSLNARVTEPFTLVIDEFPYLAREDASLPSILQRILDDPAERKFTLVLCGSSQQMMHETVLSGTAPLYGRADMIMRLNPLPAGCLSEAFPDLSAIAAVEEYAVWGGIPRYWETRQRFDDLRSAVIETLFSTTGLYYDEVNRLLLDDLRDLAQPISLLTLIAQGVNRPSELGARLGRKASDLYRPLNRLVSLGYVQREVPFSESPRKSKIVRYGLSDPFLRFYHRFVVPNGSMIGAGRGEEVWNDLQKKWAGFVSWQWEKLCEDAVRAGLLGKDIRHVGRWWGKGTDGQAAELDIVATNADHSRWIVVECKWGSPKKPVHIREVAARKLRQTTFYNGAPVEAYLAAKTDLEDREVLTPSQVLSALR